MVNDGRGGRKQILGQKTEYEADQPAGNFVVLVLPLWYPSLASCASACANGMSSSGGGLECGDFLMLLLPHPQNDEARASLKFREEIHQRSIENTPSPTGLYVIPEGIHQRVCLPRYGTFVRQAVACTGSPEGQSALAQPF